MAKQLLPFLKWPGGKRWFPARYSKCFPKTYGRYIEPFLGSGCVYFYLKPQDALLGDTNGELIATYQGVRDFWKETLRLLREHDKRHNRRHYYKVRSLVPKTLPRIAARMIYLNRACFNGIYRVNLNGVFNVPKGDRTNIIYATDDFESASCLLRTAEVRISDFEILVNEARRGDLVFADPPYTVRHNHNAFIKYNERLFSWADQERLAAALSRARDRGAHIIATNANHKSLQQLYRSHGFLIRQISRFSAISAAATRRGQFEELIILNQ
jgi:DNA adenine methylase